jgi:hypothetical protein
MILVPNAVLNTPLLQRGTIKWNVIVSLVTNTFSKHNEQ